MSNEARYRDIVALLARGVIRVKKQPLVAKAIESRMQTKHKTSDLLLNLANQDSQVLLEQSTSGGDQ
ncbi:hypothetical protein SH501x_001263 [Pirellulaceae bacterium SH501]